MEADFDLLSDLEAQLRTAKLPLEQFSTLAKEGDDKQIPLLFMIIFLFIPFDKQLLIFLSDKGKQLVEKFLTENVRLERYGGEVLQSQLYIACFWGIRDIVQLLLDKGVNASSQNRVSLWTPLHAACFQEHGPVVMALLEAGAQPEIPDSEGRSPRDFASASDKIWPHFAALGLQRVSKQELIEKSILKKVVGVRSGMSGMPAGYGIRMAAYSQPQSRYAYNSDPFIHAAVTGDVLADIDDSTSPIKSVSKSQQQPQFTLWR